MGLTVHPAAIAEAREARRWYEERDPKAADAFIRDFDAAVQRMLELPLAWPLFEAGTRRILLRRFPYHLIYREVPDGIQIVAVMHERRRPGYWHGR